MTTRIVLIGSMCLSLASMAGCPQQAAPDDEVTVRVTNNTDLDVDPKVQFGGSASSLETLDTGILSPGDVVEFSIRCDDALVLTATDSTQFTLLDDFVLDPLPIFEIDTDYFCGELIEFEFVGNELDFDVVVDAGGENIH